MLQTDIEKISLIFILLSFGVNIIVQITKDIIPVPTKLWTILISLSLCIITYVSVAGEGWADLSLTGISVCLASSFLVSYCAMYGFDTLKDLWQRFKGGENINDDN